MFVDVYLGDDDIRPELTGKRVQVRGEDAARRTPVRGEVYDGQSC